MSVHCAVCLNVSTTKGGPPALTRDEIHLARHDRFEYLCCRLHAPTVREYGIHQAIALLKHANLTEHAT